MTELAAIVPDEWRLPLFVHVLGALTLIGATTLATTSLAAAWRGGSIDAVRTGYRALLWGVFPSWIVMRVGAQWIADEQGLEDSEVAWIEIGFIASEPFLLFVIAATVLAGLAVRRAGRDGAPVAPGSGVRIAAVCIGIALAAYLVALWAMTTQPV